jgi:hypothetical protein
MSRNVLERGRVDLCERMLRAQFDGEPGRDYKLSFYLAPPLLAKRDANGQLIKKRFGSWMLPVFRAMARMKGLRGTPLDIFGKSDERRAERRLIVELHRAGRRVLRDAGSQTPG